MGRKKKAEEKVAVELDVHDRSVELQVLDAGAMRQDVKKWAIEAGLKDPVDVSEPTKDEYPRRGYGYVFSVREKEGKQRMATARYTKGGSRSFWSMDTLITG